MVRVSVHSDNLTSTRRVWLVLAMVCAGAVILYSLSARLRMHAPNAQSGADPQYVILWSALGLILFTGANIWLVLGPHLTPPFRPFTLEGPGGTTGDHVLLHKDETEPDRYSLQGRPAITQPGYAAKSWAQYESNVLDLVDHAVRAEREGGERAVGVATLARFVDRVVERDVREKLPRGAVALLCASAVATLVAAVASGATETNFPEQTREGYTASLVACRVALVVTVAAVTVHLHRQSIAKGLARRQQWLALRNAVAAKEWDTAAAKYAVLATAVERVRRVTFNTSTLVYATAVVLAVGVVAHVLTGGSDNWLRSAGIVRAAGQRGYRGGGAGSATSLVVADVTPLGRIDLLTELNGMAWSEGSKIMGHMVVAVVAAIIAVLGVVEVVSSL